MESRFRSLQHLKTKPKFGGWSYAEAQIDTWTSYDTENQKIFLKKLLNNGCKIMKKNIPKVKGQKTVFLLIKEFRRICPPLSTITDTSGKPKSRNLTVNWCDMSIREKERQMGQFIGYLCCIFICHLHLTGIICCTAFWGHRHAGRNVKQDLSLSCIFGSLDVLDRFLLVWVFWWEQYHDTATSGTDYADLRNRDNFCSVCVGKHVTVSRRCRFCARF